MNGDALRACLDDLRTDERYWRPSLDEPIAELRRVVGHTPAHRENVPRSMTRARRVEAWLRRRLDGLSRGTRGAEGRP